MPRGESPSSLVFSTFPVRGDCRRKVIHILLVRDSGRQARRYAPGMRFWLAVGIVAVAVTAWCHVVPRIRIADPEAPDFAALVSAKSTLAIGAAAAASTAVLWRVPAQSLWLWAPYIAFGVTLAGVDAATTWLPKRLHYLTLTVMVFSSAGLAVRDWGSWASALAAGGLAFGFLYLFYRLSPSLGFGDVRLAALVGAVAGQDGLMSGLSALAVGTIIGAIHGIGHSLWASRAAGRPSYFAYGPSLWAGPILLTMLA